jgi:glutaredoxin
MRLSLYIGILLSLSSSIAEAKAPEVVVFGASWCGPCRSLKAFLEQAKVPHEYKDVDDPQNLDAYEKAARGQRGIPLTVVGGRDRILGFAPEKLMSALGRSGEQKAAPAPVGVTLYGGKRAEEWQREFRELRAYQKTLEARLNQFEQVAGDELEKAELDKLRKRLAIAEDSLTLLENDASRYALPRSFRK